MSSKTIENANPRWFALVNDRIITMPRQCITGALLKTQAAVPQNHTVFRDHQSPNDVRITDDEMIDLAEGNVFYDEVGCDRINSGPCSSPAKMALCVDDRFEITALAEQKGLDILTLFGLTNETRLLRDVESPNDEPIAPSDAVRFKEGPTFLTRPNDCRPKLVSIKIDKGHFDVSVGPHTVAELKKIGGVTASDELVQIIASKPNPLSNDASVNICGGEMFISHPCRGTSS